MKINSRNPFSASWTDSNARLNPNNDGIIWRVARKVKNILCYVPNSLIAASINPRGESKFHPLESLYKKQGFFSKEIITPDHVHLSARLHIVKKVTSKTPTVILFNPLGANYSIHRGLLSSLVARKCNVVLFDYRGLGSTWRAEDLAVDGESVYQYVTQELGTKSDKVHFYGFSLGGAIAAQVKSLHPESKGKYVGDRPFKSVFSLITENCCIARFGSIIKKITSLVAMILFALPIYLLGWEWDGSLALAQMKGERRIVYHPNDSLVPFEANLASKCPLEERIRLSTNTTAASHFATIDDHLTEAGASASSVVADFLAT